MDTQRINFLLIYKSSGSKSSLPFQLPVLSYGMIDFKLYTLRLPFGSRFFFTPLTAFSLSILIQVH